jgi:carboxyl-terminal processing protease
VFVNAIIAGMETLKKHKRGPLAILIISLIVFYAGYTIGEQHSKVVIQSVENTTSGQPDNVDFAAFWKAWSLLDEKFVQASTTAKKATEQDRVWGAIRGMTASLGDPYTVFFPPEESKMFESDIRGNFEGVGMEIESQEDALTVIAPLKGSPAERAGIIAGDKIVRIDDKETAGISTEEAVQLIRGPKGTSVVFNVIRGEGSESLNITVTRDVIDIPTINSRSLGNGIFLIELYSFSAPSPNLFRNALREFIESGDDKLIVDLRGNPGGYLEAAIDMASWFLPTGKVVVKEDFGNAQNQKSYRSKGYDVFNDNLKFVILVDGGSASASEILAGALSEQKKATLIGEKTFGKGSVQELVDITPETSIKITVARWLTPNGNSISGQGITPDIVVKRTREDVLAGKDPQLDRAKEFLINGK